MSKIVIKKDGKKENFIKEKIVVCAVKSGAPVDLARDIANRVEQHPHDEVHTHEIRKSVLDELRIYNPDLPKRWLNYDKNVKRLYKHMY